MTQHMHNITLKKLTYYNVNVPYLNKIVNGITIFPSMACKKGAVLLGEAANTTNTPLNASHTPINISCH